MSITLVCDGCGEEDSIVGDDRINAYAMIGGWNLDSDGNLEPEWLGDTKVDWDSQRPRNPDKPYCCSQCGKSFSENWLATLIKPPEGEDDED